MKKYLDAGVREYWIVDPLGKRVCAYHFEKDDFPTIYAFDHEIPVGIFDGKCRIDLEEIMNYIGFMCQEM